MSFDAVAVVSFMAVAEEKIKTEWKDTPLSKLKPAMIIEFSDVSAEKV